jgi:hypothetical protein
MDSCQAGYGLTDIGPVYRGPRIYQSGRGFSSAFSTIWKFLKPVFHASLDAVKHEALKSGAHMIQDLQVERPVAESFKARGRDALKNMKSAAWKGALHGVASKMQSGGRRYKRRCKPKNKTRRKNPRKRIQPKNKKKRQRKNKNQTRALDIFT